MPDIDPTSVASTNSTYAKLIKSCFEAPPGWVFAGLDFDSLEDKISGLTTKDPNKIKVYTDGYDGHCLRAYAYFGEDMPDIDPNLVISINSIAKKYPTQRQDSKIPTFALTYQGTYNTLMVKCGFDRAKAKRIEAAYHELYKVSDAWVAERLSEAGRYGYITAAFGLRVRTPLLAQVIRGNRRTPYEAEAEGRSAGNALGQSWCLLNSRAGSEFMGKVRASAYRLNIRPCSQIHDAQYFLIKDDMGAIQYTNEHLVRATQWQSHPNIYHPDVKLGGSLAIFYPDWSKNFDLPNGATEEQILEAIDKHLNG
jgi:DNA polymerase-1